MNDLIRGNRPRQPREARRGFFAPLLLLGSVAAYAADLPKQASVAVTHAVAASAPASFETGGKRSAIINARVISTNDAGSGFFHLCSGHCLALDAMGQLSGICVWTDRDGDQFGTSFGGEGALPRNIKTTLHSGTGKYKGIEGTGEGKEEPPLADTAPGLRNLISRQKFNYRIP